MTQSDDVAKLAREMAAARAKEMGTLAFNIFSAIGVKQTPGPSERLWLILQEIYRRFDEKDAQLTALAAEVERLRRELHTVTETLEEHPEGYDGECLCKLCMSYGDS